MEKQETVYLSVGGIITANGLRIREVKFYIMKDFLNWLIGLPKCIKGGRCNIDVEIEYSLHSKKFFQKSNRWKCSKCNNETTDYGKI